MKEEYVCPCRDIDPKNFLENEEVIKLLETKEEFKFTQKDYLKLYNCIHCNDCGISEERFMLKQKFLDDGNKIEGLKEMIQVLETYGTPFKINKSRIKPIPGVSKHSSTLLYLGCFTTVKTPQYGVNAIKYLLSQKIKFCILEEEICCGYPILCTGSINIYEKLVDKNLKLFKGRGFSEIITVCPSCFMVFKKHYSKENIRIRYFTEYLKPSEKKKSGNLIIQHACPLRNGEMPGIVEYLEKLYKESGYNVIDKIPTRCCGFGVGHQLRIDISEAIAVKRMLDFKDEGGFLEDLKEGENYITSYCPDAYWVLKAYGRKKKVKFKVKDMCDLLL
ncbi:MAG: (Fe-S)-binding protein [Candidatus Lokiarchaeota archaeon]|nr:(Fe-S)-binding protein [Candidatus Lokiarchaeota archaeon]